MSRVISTILSETETSWRQTVDWKGSGRNRSVYSWVIIRHLPGSTEENGENIWMVHVPAEIQT